MIHRWSWRRFLCCLSILTALSLIPRTADAWVPLEGGEEEGPIGGPGDGGGESPPDLEPEPPSPFFFDTPAHTAAAGRVWETNACVREGDRIRLEEVRRWINDPDCLYNTCEGANDITAPQGTDSYRIAFLRSVCWACRNPDHFGSNFFPGWNGRGSLGNSFAAAWTPADNSTAEIVMRTKAQELASQATTAELRKPALQMAFQACHYLTDRMACGHRTGNVFCDPSGQSPASQQCKEFVERNTGLLNGVLNLPDTAILAATHYVCQGFALPPAVTEKLEPYFGPLDLSCGPLLQAGGWTPTASLAYAAQERFLRHHSAGRELLGDTNNHRSICDSHCTSGECLAGQPGQPQPNSSAVQELADACDRLVQDVCDRFPKNRKIVAKTCTRTGEGSAYVTTACVDAPAAPDGSGTPVGYTDCSEAMQHEEEVPEPSECHLNGATCGDGVCGPGESTTSCCSDCGCASPGFTCADNACSCVSVAYGECGTVIDNCGTVHNWGPCFPGQTCVANLCQDQTAGCGNGICEASESHDSCCTDCGCAWPGFSCTGNSCSCVSVVYGECGSKIDNCGSWQNWGSCPSGLSCVNNLCQPGGGDGGGGGGGGGGSGGCDEDGDGFVTPQECVGACGGSLEGGNCVLLQD
jgi:hypothetical protein